MFRGTLATVLLLAAMPVFAANPAPATTTATTAIDADSQQTREELRSLLHRYPPEVGRVLKLDPTLFGNQAYMANYPALATFVAQHPEVGHNPGYFLQSVSIPFEREMDPPSMRMWKDILGGFGGFMVFLIITAVLIWMIRTLVEQRRWSQLSKIQREVHSKILDRFTSNEELLAYIQTPAGKRFLESAPIPLESGARPISAPIGRIFWSVQVGLVAIAVGIGFDLVSARVSSEAAEVLYGIGMISLLIGVAFVISAMVFYALSRRLGLWQAPPAAPNES